MHVYTTSPWIPAEWIKAHGLEPRGVWLSGKLRFDGVALSAGVCPFAEAIQRLTVAEAEDVMVFTTTCDQMRRSHDALPTGDHRRAFLFNLPATWQTPVAAEIYRTELERLGRFLQTVGGHAPSAVVLRQELTRRGRVRSQLLEAATTCSAIALAEAVARFHWNGTFSLSVEPPPPTASGVPLAIVGGPLCRSQWPLLRTIEAAGGRVVLNATEAGERSLWPEVPWEDSTEQPLDLLARTFFANIVDAFQRPNKRLYDWLQPQLMQRQVRGIVLWAHTGCDLWRAEARTMRERCGLPVLLLEASDERGDAPREHTRLQAFVETLE